MLKTITIASSLLSLCTFSVLADTSVSNSTTTTATPPSVSTETTNNTTDSLSVIEGQATTNSTAEKKEDEVPGYNIVFEKNTKKKLDLDNKLIKVQLYKFSKPYKTIQTKTSDTGEIKFGEEKVDNIGVDLFYIEGQENLKVQCNGYALPGKKEINVMCE